MSEQAKSDVHHALKGFLNDGEIAVHWTALGMLTASTDVARAQMQEWREDADDGDSS